METKWFGDQGAGGDNNYTNLSLLEMIEVRFVNNEWVLMFCFNGVESPKSYPSEQEAKAACENFRDEFVNGIGLYTLSGSPHILSHSGVRSVNLHNCAIVFKIVGTVGVICSSKGEYAWLPLFQSENQQEVDAYWETFKQTYFGINPP